MTETERAIKAQMRKALERLGADPAQLARVDRARTLDAPKLYEAAELLAADRFLLAAIGSFHDTLDDAEVLQELRDWNAAPLEARRRS